MRWYVIHTKPRQEHRALLNLQQQGYDCYLPLLAVQKLRHGALTVVQEPLFSRYLFIQLDTDQEGQSWGPIRSTLGVNRLVTFGTEPATISTGIIDQLRSFDKTVCANPQRLFSHGDMVQIKDGPFAGIEGIYQMDDGDRRAMVLIELLGKPSALAVSPGSIRKIQTANPAGYQLGPSPEQATLKVLRV
jgi:transcriptional antiterminator RfaH